MKTAALRICIAALSVTAAQAEQSSCGVCGTRQTHPSDVKLENPPALENGESFSMILYGDPQTYTKNTFSQPIFELMTAWTAAHKDALKIKAVLCTGGYCRAQRHANGISPHKKRHKRRRPKLLTMGGGCAGVLAPRRGNSVHTVHRQPRLRLRKLGKPQHIF